MARCRAITNAGTPCTRGAVAGREYCFFHDRDPQTGKQKHLGSLSKEKEIEIVENALRGVRAMRRSLDKGRLVIQLVELLERLKKETTGEVDVRSLTAEERLARR